MSRPLDRTGLCDETGAIVLREFSGENIADSSMRPSARDHQHPPQRLSPRVLGGMVRLLDSLLLLVSAWTVFLLPSASAHPHDAAGGFAVATLIAIYAAVAVLNWSGAYELAALRYPRRHALVIAGALLAAAVTQYACRSVLHEALADPAPTFQFALLAAFLLLAARSALGLCIARWVADGRLVCRTAIIGVNEVSRELLSRIGRDSNSAIEIVGVYGDWPRDTSAPPPDIAVAGDIDDLLAESRRSRLDAITVALPLHEAARATEIASRLGSAIADIYLVSDLPGAPLSAADASPLGASVALSIRRQPIKDWRAVQKTVFDYTFAALLLLLLSPLMLGVAIAIRLESRGPVLFRQPRLGFNNRPFVVFKFRTMYDEMCDLLADCQAKRRDPRITPLGRWLRRLSIDELPQLFNVLRGEMSLVGPRPHAPNTRAAGLLFGDAVAVYANRHRVKPGITGWAQVNGWRGETTSVHQIERRVAHDLYYIDNWSLVFDIRIILLTLLREVVSRHAY